MMGLCDCVFWAVLQTCYQFRIASCLKCLSGPLYDIGYRTLQLAAGIRCDRRTAAALGGSRRC